eukprot:TRINITY_DN3838_c0_g1_i1.p1 TRINITY_DN3838_c0_g1~~TRINITY_DN3838_c0_g1_i1.p1  ORF type:complete len:527 (-),score=103.35 TRINITY_DN3838_c0_g1_i1:328-1908(-)
MVQAEETFADLYNSMANAAEDALEEPHTNFSPAKAWVENEDRLSLLGFDHPDPEPRTSKMNPRLQSLMCCVAGLRAACQGVLVAGETSVVPYLMANELPISTAGLVFLINPVVCFMLHPWLRGVGLSAINRHRRHRAYIVVFSIAGAAALLVLTQLELIREKYGWQKWVVSVFVMFGVVDVCAEVVMALADKAVEDAANGDDAVHRQAIQVVDICSAVGRMAAYGTAALPVERIVPLFVGWEHMRAVFVVAAIGFLAMAGSLVFAMHEEPNRPARAQTTSATHSDPDNGPKHQSASYSLASMEGKLSDRGYAALQLLWLSALIGRVLVLELAFYWTTWIGYKTTIPGTAIRLGCLGLCLQSLSSALTALSLDWIESRTGDFRVTFFGALVCTAASMTCLAASSHSLGPYLMLSFMSGCGYAVLVHSPRRITCQVLAEEDLMDQRAMYLGLVTSVAPIAQVVVGLASGFAFWVFFEGQVAWFYTLTGTGAMVLFGMLFAVEFHFGWLLEYTEKAKAKPKKKGNIGNH